MGVGNRFGSFSGWGFAASESHDLTARLFARFVRATVCALIHLLLLIFLSIFGAAFEMCPLRDLWVTFEFGPHFNCCFLSPSLGLPMSARAFRFEQMTSF